MTFSYTELGWSDFFDAQQQELARPDWSAARVCVARRGGCVVMSPAGSTTATFSGRLRHNSPKASDLPAVGDWVAMDARGVIHHRYERRTRFARQAPSGRGVQVIAVNVDVVFVVTSLNRDLNMRRLERYVAAVWDAGAQPIVVLNKADLCENAEQLAETVRASLLGVEVRLASAKAGQLDELRGDVGEGRSIALVGSSGVGKSTIVNALLGDETQAVADIRDADAKGRHTTTHRELFVLPGGRGLLIDTPGMRELQLDAASEAVQETFEEIATLGETCRFRDCTHSGEPGCQVVGAVDPARLASWHKLQAEIEAKERRETPEAQRKFERAFARVIDDAKRIKEDGTQS